MTLGRMRRRSRVANDRRSTCTDAATALINSSPTSNAVKELFLIDPDGTLLTALAACPICFLFGLPRVNKELLRVHGFVGRSDPPAAVVGGGLIPQPDELCVCPFEGRRMLFGMRELAGPPVS